MKLSIVMPCLNEEQTLRTCIYKAKKFISSNGIEGEIIIADNGSTDSSVNIAKEENVRVVHISRKGYGAALRGGINVAKGEFIIMGDADDSYDFSNLSLFLRQLEDGCDLVMGNRFKGGIKKGAMPFLHRYLGNPVLSFIGRLFFNSSIGDFHCGLRGFSKEAFEKMDLKSPGMEFASEMVVKATLMNLRIVEVPIILYPDGRDRPPHLNTWSDGWRHLKFLLLYSPKWLLLIPGMFFFIIGFLMSFILVIYPISFSKIHLDIHTLLYMSAFSLIGSQMIILYVIVINFMLYIHKIPIKSKNSFFLYDQLTINKGVVLGGVLSLLGLIMAFYNLENWISQNFINLDPKTSMRWAIPSVFLLFLGIQIITGSFINTLILNKKE